MTDVLQIGLSGLLAFQRGLSTTANNVANASTEGYSRQRVDLASRTPQGFGYGYVGTGVEVASVRRIFDQFGINQLRTSSSSLGQLDAFSSFANQLDDLLGNPNAGIASGMQSFFNAWQDVSNDPASLPARQLLLAQAQSLADRFSSTDSRLNDIERDLNGRIRSTITEINSLATTIARYNDDIVKATAGLGQPPNDLLDQRDQALEKLSALTNMTVLDEPDGSVNVFIGSGQAIVLRSQVLGLEAGLNEFDPSRLDVIYRGGGGSSQLVTSALSDGGKLGGLLQARTELLDPARNALGQVATALALSVNAQHREGMDLTGALGADLFTLSPPQALADESNTGSASVAFSISDISGLTAEDYSLRYDGANYGLLRGSDGQAVALTGSGTGADPFVADGLSIVLSGTANAGDRFLLRPTRLGAATLQTAISDPRAVAAAAPIRTSAAGTNTGSGAVSAGEVLDVSDGALLDTVTIEFLTDSTYSVNGAGSFAYTGGGDIDINGWRVQITGAPAVNDTFTIQSNSGGVGDNRNALQLAQLQNQAVLAGGTASISDTFGSLVGSIGSKAQQAALNREAQSAIAAQAREQVLATSGVNLDEEAADMLRWQQAYQAAAQTISVANSMFQTLLSAFQR